MCCFTMTTTVSIDVGIKHLAVCVLGAEESILQWDVLNLLQQQQQGQQQQEVEKICGFCKRKARYWNSSDHGRLYCLAHAKAAVARNECIWLSKWGPKKQDVIDACPAWLQEVVVVTRTNKQTKEQWVETMTLHSLQPVKMPSKKKASEVSLIEIGRAMVARMDALLLSGRVDVVLIENQISPIANRMKTLQGMLTAYFLLRYPAASIHYVSSSNKLRGLGKEKQEEDVDNYANHKKSAVTLCRGELQGAWLAWFEGHKKKDDLADCYLQGVVWLRHTNIKRGAENLEINSVRLT